MKKWFIAFLVIVVLGIVSIYIFIPNTLEISKTAYLNNSPDVVYRNLSEETKWSQWWPIDSFTGSKEAVSPHSHFVHENNKYSILYKSIDEIEIVIESGEEKLNSRILIIPLKKDSTALHWKSVVQTGINPFRRIQRYEQAKKLHRDMETIFSSLQSYLGKTENLYSVPIERTLVKDTLLMSTKASFDHYPTTAEVYDLIKKLKHYIILKEGKETNYPMLNVLKMDLNRFQVMVAVPVDKKMSETDDFVFKRMVPGNILVTTVKGGRTMIDKAFAEMELYLKDNQLIPPAIPFQLLVTDRSNEPDSNKWVTRIYFPIL